MKFSGSLMWLLASQLLFIVICCAQDSRQDPKNETKLAHNETCGTTTDLAQKVEVCAEPLMSLLEGTVKKWPQNEQDIVNLCTSFGTSERCIRDLGRKCAKGIHRTIISTLASSVQRARKRECTKPKYNSLLKLTQCVEKNQSPIQNLIANATSRLYVIENQMPDADKRTSSLCCMVNDMETEIKALLIPKCSSETALLIRLYRALLEDVIELICQSPKCDNIFKGYKFPKLKKGVGVISIVLRIVFSLGE